MHHKDIYIQKDTYVLKKLESHKYWKDKIENLFLLWLQNDSLSQLIVLKIIE